MDDTKESKFDIRKKIASFLAGFKSFLTFLYDHKKREVIGRDGLSWTKISLFYFAFYIVLGSVFVGMLAVFAATLNANQPRYFSETSVMSEAKDEENGGKRVNPGLGFRPQLDPEANLISYSIKTDKNQRAKRLKDSLDIYLHNYFNRYNSKNTTYSIDCHNMSLADARKSITNGFHCKYDYETELADTYCSHTNNYGYMNSHVDGDYGPCVALKLNKIYDWLPVAYKNESNLPKAIKDDIKDTSLIENNIFIKCHGEYSSDKDAVNKMNLTYYSPNSHQLKVLNIGVIPFYYYPYLNQFGYESPLVFLHFKNAPRNQLINVICKAYAANIDSDDKRNLRGMTQIQFFIES